MRDSYREVYLDHKHLNRGGHIITSKIEHPSILNTLKYLESEGFSVTYLDVSKDGLVSADSVLEAIKEDTFLVSTMAVNNEIGTINQIDKIGQICRNRGITFHVDAIQRIMGHYDLVLALKLINRILTIFSGFFMIF